MISVVTITKDNPEDLRKTLKSIQGIENIESVVINGGNDPKTLDVLKYFTGIHINEPDEGISDAFNKGIKYSSGNAILFLNSGDILIDKDYLIVANQCLKEDKDLTHIHADMTIHDRFAGKLKVISYPHRHIAWSAPYKHPTLIIRREIFDKIGGFKTSFKIAMDYELIIRLKKIKHKGYYYDRDVVLMDGLGISSTERVKCNTECFRALLLHYNIFYFIVPFLRKSIKVYAGSLLVKLKLGFLIKIYRRTRYEKEKIVSF